jgi:hypothetical protein
MKDPAKVAAYNRAYYRANAERIKAGAKVRRTAQSDDTRRERARDRRRRLYALDPEGERRKLREYRAQNPERVRQWSRKYHLKRLYGLTPAEFGEMSLAQGGRCLVCHEAAKLVVDHDHTTGEIRGLLCVTCNMLLGVIEGHPALVPSLFDYLERSGSELPNRERN